MKKLDIKYDQAGTGSNYGIRVKGNLEYLLKFIFYLTSKGAKFPLTSHHGTFFYLEDHQISLRLAMRNWTHTNKGNGNARPILIFENSDWETAISKEGYEGRRQKTISIDSKTGLKKIVNRIGHEIADSWNDQNESPSVSIVPDIEIEFDSIDTDPKIVEFVEKLQELCEITALV